MEDRFLIAALFMLTFLSASQPSAEGNVPTISARTTQQIVERVQKRVRGWSGRTTFGNGVLVMGRCLVRSPTGGYDAYSVLGSGNRAGWSGTMQRLYSTGTYAGPYSGRHFLPPRGPACTPEFGSYRGKMVF